MKFIFILALFLPAFANAQTIGVKDIPADAEGETTISVKKGSSKSERQYEVVTTEDEIEGDSASLLKEAKSNWKKACNDWKKESKDLNKDNKVIQINCGKMVCSTESMESTCTSKSKMVVRVRLED